LETDELVRWMRALEREPISVTGRCSGIGGLPVWCPNGSKAGALPLLLPLLREEREGEPGILKKPRESSEQLLLLPPLLLL